MGVVGRSISRLQQSQLSVQALTRLSSIYVFLLASWTDTEHLALIALQGTLLAIPYALLEALIGRPLAADIVPSDWDLRSWAAKTAVAIVVPIGLLGYIAASLALPDSSQGDRLLMIVPIVLQLPIEALFWATAKTRSRRWANLLPQVTALGTVLTGTVFGALGVTILLSAVPAQLLVLAWALFGTTSGPGAHQPTVRESLRIGWVYCLAIAIDLSYSVTLPTVAGALVGQTAIVVLRAMDLAFGPFHVALAATAREDIVGGKGSRLMTGARALTVASLFVVSAVVLGSARLRGLLAADLAALSVSVVAIYCVYKALLMVSTWLSTRHMIRVPPNQFLVSAIGSRVVAFASVATSTLWVTDVPDLFLQLLVCEAIVVSWYICRFFVTASHEVQGPPVVSETFPSDVDAPAGSGLRGPNTYFDEETTGLASRDR